MGRPRIALKESQPWLAAGLVALGAVSLAASELHAQPTPQPGPAVTRGFQGWERVQKGLWEIGHEQMLLVRWAASGTDPKVSALSANFVGGITPRYFVIDNLALGLSLNAFLGMDQRTVTTAGQSATTEHKDVGLLAFATVNYFLRLGHGMFFAPGLGLGGLYGQRFTPDPTDPGRALQSTLAGFAGRLDLGFVFYASRRVNLKAGLDVLVRVGSESFASGDPTTFLSVDAGFHVGIAYVF